MSEPYDGPDEKHYVQVDDQQPEEALVVLQDGILEGDAVNANAFARDILASIVDEAVRRSKMTPVVNGAPRSLVIGSRVESSASGGSISTADGHAKKGSSVKIEDHQSISDTTFPNSELSDSNISSHHSSSESDGEAHNDKVNKSSSDKISARNSRSESQTERETNDKSQKRILHRGDWDDLVSNDSFASVAENDPNADEQENLCYYSADEKEKVRDLNADPNIDMLCFSSLESLGSLKELPSEAKAILNMLSHKTVETSQSKNTTSRSNVTEGLNKLDNQNLVSEEKQFNSLVTTTNTSLSNDALLSCVEHTNDKMEESKLDIALLNKKELTKTYLETDNMRTISEKIKQKKEQIVERNYFKMSGKEDITMETSVEERRVPISIKGEVNIEENVALSQSTSEVEESFADAVQDTAEIKGDITHSESGTIVTKEDDFTAMENTEDKEDNTAFTENNSHGENTPTDVEKDTSGVQEETPENEQDAACDAHAETTIQSAALHAPDHATELASPAPPSAKCPTERPAAAAGTSAERRRPASPPLPPPLVAELSRQSPSSEQLSDALAKMFSTRAARVERPEYDLFWSSVGLLRRYEDPMRPTSSRDQPAGADADAEGEGGGDAQGEGDVWGEGESEEDWKEHEEVAAAIDAIDALFPRTELDEDGEDEDDLDEGPPRHVELQRDDEEDENPVQPSFRRVDSVHNHSAITSIPTPRLPYEPSSGHLTTQPAIVKEKISFGKRLKKFFSHTFTRKKNKAKKTGLVTYHI